LAVRGPNEHQWKQQATRRGLLAAGAAGAAALIATKLSASTVDADAPGDDPWFDVRAFGAKGDGTTDDTAAIQRALDTAGNGKWPTVGGIVFMARGNYMISSRLVVPWRVCLVGAGRDATTIKALSSFPTSTELVRLGNVDGSIGMNCQIENMTVDCSDIKGSTAIYSEGINEQCGIFRILVWNFGAYGIRINEPASHTNAPQHWTIDEVEIGVSKAAPASAIGLAVTMTTLTMPFRHISRVSAGGAWGARLTTMIKLDGMGAGRVSEIHVENCDNGILVGSVVGCWGTTFMACDGMSDVNNLLVWSKTPGSGGLSAIGLENWAFQNTLVDGVNGFTLTGPVAHYAMGMGDPNHSTVLSTDYNVPSRLRGLQVLGTITHAVASPNFSASFTPDTASGHVQQVLLTGSITVKAPVNATAGQKLLFIFTQDGVGGRTIGYDPSCYQTGAAEPVRTAPSTTTVDEFVCTGGKTWRLCSRMTGQ
jgi:hypothetical protein